MEIATKNFDVPISYLQGYETNGFFGITINRDIGETFKSGTDLLIRKTQQVKPGDYVILKTEDGPTLLRRILVDHIDEDCYILTDPSFCCENIQIDKVYLCEHCLLGVVFLAIRHFNTAPGGAAQ